MQVVNGVRYISAVGNATFSVSDNGVLAYQAAGDESNIMWVDRRGEITETGWPTQSYGTFRFSPDGQRVLADVLDPRTGAADLWIYDAARGAPVRLTSDAADESGPLWSPDMKRVLFAAVGAVRQVFASAPLLRTSTSHGRAMFRVPVRPAPAIDTGAPTRLFAINASTATGSAGATRVRRHA